MSQQADASSEVLPSTEEAAQVDAESVSSVAMLEEPSLKVETVELAIPFGEIPPGAYVSRTERVEFTSMTRRQSVALKKLTRGLEDSGKKLDDGTLIKRPGQAMRWLLEQIYQPEEADY